jgi:hypothetical protein
MRRVATAIRNKTFIDNTSDTAKVWIDTQYSRVTFGTGISTFENLTMCDTLRLNQTNATYQPELTSTANGGEGINRVGWYNEDTSMFTLGSESATLDLNLSEPSAFFIVMAPTNFVDTNAHYILGSQQDISGNINFYQIIAERITPGKNMNMKYGREDDLKSNKKGDTTLKTFCITSAGDGEADFYINGVKYVNQSGITMDDGLLTQLRLGAFNTTNTATQDGFYYALFNVKRKLSMEEVSFYTHLYQKRFRFPVATVFEDV